MESIIAALMLFLILTIAGCHSVSSSASLVSVPVGSTSYKIQLKIFAITAVVEKYQSIMTKKTETWWNSADR